MLSQMDPRFRCRGQTLTTRWPSELIAAKGDNNFRSDHGQINFLLRFGVVNRGPAQDIMDQQTAMLPYVSGHVARELPAVSQRQGSSDS